MKHDTPHILLVNPWIHDFAAYDFWAKPLGLLSLASILRFHGIRVSYIDCLDRFHPKALTSDPGNRQGRGPYLKTKIPNPKGLEDIPRVYSRYGILPQWFIEDLSGLPEPDLILVTSFMTYWYPGVFETIALLKDTYPETPVVLGGIYAALCRDHAGKNSGADRIISGPGEGVVLDLVKEYTGFSARLAFDPENPDSCPRPAFELQRKITYIPIVTSKGCPFSCAYCASSYLNPERKLRTPDAVVDEIIYWHKTYKVNDFAFYDDALLINSEQHAVPVFEKIITSGINVRFHTPNALHIREISDKTARLMYRAGFKTIRLGLETASFKQRDEIDHKVTEHEFKQAVTNLLAAGFKQNQIGAYLLTGLPGQTLEEVEDSINTVKKYRITPVPAYYTPIPHTAMWERAVLSSRYDLKKDPVFTNNAIFPCWKENFSWDLVARIKNLVSE